MEAESNPKVSATGPVRRPPRLWHWFAGGFLLVFVGMLLLVRITAMDPSGQYAVRYRLWPYYAVMVPREFKPSTLGPASGGTPALVETMGLHGLISAAGGCVAAGVGWWLGERGSRRSTEPRGAPGRDGT